jgi:transposase InsO family protein
MTDQQQSINLRQQAMNLHQAGRNVTQICFALGKSRTWFYKWFDRYRIGGSTALQNQIPWRCPVNRTPLESEGKILDIIMQLPNAGPETIALRLKQQGVTIGKTAVHGIMKRNHLNKRQQRLERLRILSGEVIKLSDLETARQKAKHRHIQAENPGDLVCLDLFYVGCLKGIGRIYQMTACDAATSFAWAQLYTDKSAYAARDFLAHILIQSHGVKVKAILTDNGKEFTTHWQSKNHKFENVLRKLNIQHRYTQVRHPWTNGFVERLNRTILEEFYQVALRKKIYCTLEDLQIDLNQFLNDYNFNRPHQGYRLKGRCPADLFCHQRSAA